MAGPERFELPTSSFEDLLSIQLNYGPISGVPTRTRTQNDRVKVCSVTITLFPNKNWSPYLDSNQDPTAPNRKCNQITLQRDIEFVSLRRIYRRFIQDLPAAQPDLEHDGYHLGYLSSLQPICPWTLRAQVGVEPIAFYYFGSSNLPRQRDFFLLTLTKLVSNGGTRTHDRHRMKVVHQPLCYVTIQKHTAYHLYVHYYMTGCTLCKFAMQLAPHSMFLYGNHFGTLTPVFLNLLQLTQYTLQRRP